jgi:hypothetical protein
VELTVWPVFVKNAFYVKENDEHALNFALQLSRLFLPKFRLPTYGLCFLLRTLV